MVMRSLGIIHNNAAGRRLSKSETVRLRRQNRTNNTATALWV